MIAQLRQELEARKDRLADAVASGSVADWAEYKAKTGRIAGIKDALNTIDTLMKRQEIQDE